MVYRNGRSRGPQLRPVLAGILLLSLLLVPVCAHAYSVQTHEQLIDLAWKGSIVPLLKSRYPSITPAELRRAHAYAYGGSAIQDLGYYPFGSEFFSDRALPAASQSVCRRQAHSRIESYGTRTGSTGRTSHRPEFL